MGRLMPLPKQKLTYNFGIGGSDQKTDPKFVPLGRPTELANVRHAKNGALSKRYGMTPATTDQTNSIALKRLIPHGNGLVAIGTSAAGVRTWYALSRSSDADQYPRGSSLVALGGTPPVPKAWVDNILTGVHSATGISAITAAIGLSKTCYLFIASGQAYYSIVDNATGAALRNSSLIGSYDQIHVAAVPNSDSFVLSMSNSTTLDYRLVSGSGTLQNSSLGAILNANLAWDMAIFGSVIIWAYRTAAAATVTVKAATATSSSIGTVSTSSTVSIGAGSPDKVAVCTPYASTEDAAILTSDTTNGIRGFTIGTASLTVVQSVWTLSSATTTLRNQLAGCRLSNGSVFALSEVNSATDYLTSINTITAAVGSGGTIVNMNNMYMASKPVATSDGLLPMMVLAHSSKVGSSEGLQHARFLYQARSAASAYGLHVVGAFLRGDVSLPPTAQSVSCVPEFAVMPANVNAYGGLPTEYMCPAARLLYSEVDESGSTTQQCIAAMRFDVNPSSGFGYTHDGDVTIVQGGYLALIDGGEAGSTLNDPAVCENGFLLYPEIVSATASSAAGSLSNNGTFDLVAVFFYLDAKGQVHRSAPSEVVTVTTGAADNTLTVLVRGLVATQKGTYGIELYRTENDGSIFYLAEYQRSLIRNGNTTVSFTITGSDATLIASTPLGQQSGILDNSQPVCPVSIGSNGRRIHAVSGADRYAVIEGKERRKVEGATFFDNVTRRITQDGEIVALEAIGERWVAAKERRIFVASGEGSDDSGQADTLSEFEAHPTIGAGLSRSRAIVKTSHGVIFQSAKGFHLLDAGGAISPVGFGIDDYRDYPVISAAYHEDRDEVYFALLDGPMLVLSLFQSEQGVSWRWGIFEQNDSASPYIDLAVVDGLLYAATQDRSSSNPYALMVEDVGGYSDQSASYPVVMRITTGWIPITGELQGRGRLYRALFLGTVKAPHTARVRAAYDYVDTWIDDKSVTSANATTGGSAYQWEFRPSRQKIQAVRFEFTETLAAPSEGAVLNQLLMMVGIEPDAKKLPTAKRAA